MMSEIQLDLNADAVFLNVHKELKSPLRDDDDVDDETISAFILKYRLSHGSVFQEL